jgi:hypothetical protein
VALGSGRALVGGLHDADLFDLTTGAEITSLVPPDRPGAAVY